MRFLQEEYKKSARDGVPTILIGNISFFTGIDLPNELLNTLIIGKLPFEPNEILKKKIINHSAFSSVINNRNKAIVTFRQGLGRGIRNKDDRVFIAICDPRLYDKKNKNFLYFLQEMSIPHKIEIMGILDD
jgi:ATP-dependent DNA helicase DinG